ncbi:hypothetical protein SELMODRAFT_417017 [Selaginella moellendorffii]|uniref:Secreted protein n=1 Tax=Selaginella moellendorffii TaxID=88036 RepID=D8S140_SELML|nr:hypothetical protein SELMODRAFT_417017 [Selaginella moellendorffii]
MMPHIRMWPSLVGWIPMVVPAGLFLLPHAPACSVVFIDLTPPLSHGSHGCHYGAAMVVAGGHLQFLHWLLLNLPTLGVAWDDFPLPQGYSYFRAEAFAAAASLSSRSAFTTCRLLTIPQKALPLKWANLPPVTICFGTPEQLSYGALNRQEDQALNIPEAHCNFCQSIANIWDTKSSRIQ